MKSIALPLLVLLLIVSSCDDKHEIRTVASYEEFDLKLGELVLMEDQPLAIRYTKEVENKMCPPNLACLLSGGVIVQIMVGKEIHELGLLHNEISASAIFTYKSTSYQLTLLGYQWPDSNDYENYVSTIQLRIDPI